MFVERKIDDVDGGEKQIMNASQVFRLAMSMTDLGGSPLPEHRKSDGTVDGDVFRKRVAFVKKQANPITTLLTTHLGWFDRRIYAALSPDSLKNG